MKIEKLYTSLGFGLYLKRLTITEFCQLSGAEPPRLNPRKTNYENALEFYRIYAFVLRLRNDFDKKLLQKPTKEMFVNPYEKPIFPTENRTAYDGLAELYDYELKQWQEAEKKVIFKNVKNISENGYLIFEIDGNRIDLFEDSFLVNHIPCNNIEQLANATNGELPINLEL